MLLEKTYKNELEIYGYIRNNKKYIQNLSYFLSKDANVISLISLMKKVANTKIFDEEFRRSIIINNYEDNIKYFKKILGIYSDFFNLKGSFINTSSFDEILKCCHIFPDNHGKRFLKQFGLYKIVILSCEVISLFNNGSFTDEDLEVMLEKQSVIKIFLDDIYTNEDIYLKYIEQNISNLIEQKQEQDSQLKDSFKSLIDVMTQDLTEVDSNYNIDNITLALKEIKAEGDVDVDKTKFISDLPSLLSGKMFISINKRIIKLTDNNNFVFVNFDTIIKTFINNKI